MKFQFIDSRRDIKAIALFVVFYVGLGAYLMVFQNRLIYQPDQQSFEKCVDFAGAEHVIYRGTRMYAHFDSPRVAIVYHGNAGSACDRAFIAEILKVNGYSYIVPEYAGYSADSVRPTSELLIQDVEHVVAFLDTKAHTEVLIIGESVGSGLAALHTSINPPDKLLLLSPFSSILDVAKNKFWYYPVALMGDNVFQNEKALKDYSGAVRIIHGDKDQTIPLKLGKKLYDSLISQAKEMIVINGAGHNDIFDFLETHEAIVSFLGMAQ